MRYIDADKVTIVRQLDDDGRTYKGRPIVYMCYKDGDKPPLTTDNVVPVRWIKVWGRRNNQKDIIKNLLNDWREYKKDAK